jgi:hypothetical protein
VNEVTLAVGDLLTFEDGKTMRVASIDLAQDPAHTYAVWLTTDDEDWLVQVRKVR